MSIWRGKLLPICSTIKKSLDIRTILINKIIKRNKDALACIFDDINISQDGLTEESIRKLSAEQQPLLLFPTILTAHIPFDMNISFLIIYILVVCSFSVIPVQFYFTMTSIEPGRRRVMPSGPTAVTREI